MHHIVSSPSQPSLHKKDTLVADPTTVPPDQRHLSAAKYAILLMAFVIGHIVIALAMKQNSTIATLHALAVFSVGLLVVIASPRPEYCALVVGYIAGSEVLWRMCGANIFWESGKYGASMLLVVSILRSGNFSGTILPLAYFAFLLPSTLLLLVTKDLNAVREDVSFNLSGPLSMAICMFYFSRLQTSTLTLRILLIAIVGPIVGIAAIAAHGILTASSIKFMTQSNYASSGGFGPVQVSSILGWGGLIALLFSFSKQYFDASKTIMLCLLVWLLAQSALTFSRGGLYAFAGAAIVGMLFLASDPRGRMKIMVVAVVVAGIAQFLVIPQLDMMTGGAIAKRFSNTSTTGRDAIVESELGIWIDNPILGVGPGQAVYQHSSHISHTEFTRLLAEHGVFGLLALGTLGAIAIKAVRSQKTSFGRTVAASLVTWSGLFMASDGMRFVAVSLAVGVALMVIDSVKSNRIVNQQVGR